MIFKNIRSLIYSPLELVVNDEKIDNVEVNDPAIDVYNYYEVIGIRAAIKYFDNFEEERLIISLKPTMIDYYTKTSGARQSNQVESGCSCKK